MFRLMSAIICLSVLCSGPAAAVVAGSTRVVSFTFACDGSQKKVLLNATGFPANSNQPIAGGALNVYSIPATSTLEYIRLSDSSSYHTILVSGLNELSARFAMPTTFSETANASGSILIEVLGACKGGGSVSGYATIYFL